MSFVYEIVPRVIALVDQRFWRRSLRTFVPKSGDQATRVRRRGWTSF